MKVRSFFEVCVKKMASFLGVAAAVTVLRHNQTIYPEWMIDSTNKAKRKKANFPNLKL